MKRLAFTDEQLDAIIQGLLCLHNEFAFDRKEQMEALVKMYAVSGREFPSYELSDYRGDDINEKELWKLYEQCVHDNFNCSN